MDSFAKETNKCCTIFLILALIICVCAVVGIYHHDKTNNVIEKDIELQKHNDSLRIEVNNLDSIKNAKVIEVQTLDNDSTVKLFYQLIK